MKRLLRTAAALGLYWTGFALYGLACLCGETSARLWVIDHPEPVPDDDDDNAPVELLDHEREPERPTLH
jgi:hypothetical protein